MAEQTLKPRTTRIFEPVARSYEINVMPLFAALIRGRKSIGLTEDDVIKGSGLARDDALGEIAKLEAAGFIRSFLCQEGTAGPYARRYRLPDEVEVKLEVSKPE